MFRARANNSRSLMCRLEENAGESIGRLRRAILMLLKISKMFKVSFVVSYTRQKDFLLTISSRRQAISAPVVRWWGAKLARKWAKNVKFSSVLTQGSLTPAKKIKKVDTRGDERGSGEGWEHLFSNSYQCEKLQSYSSLHIQLSIYTP